MSDSEDHDMDEQPLVYEEEEVLWAKIRGYPWWPAFVDKVHGANNKEDEEIGYTVFFFGDNTHSQLGASKLRRFLDYYTQFFPKAKTNRKLYLSIMKAEQKLKQNGGNVEIFQTLRNSMKKLKKSKGHHKTQSRISSQDLANNMLSQLPQMMRHKTYPNNHQKQQDQNQSEQQPSIQVQRQQPKRRGRKPKKQILKQEKKGPQKIQAEESDQQKSQPKQSFGQEVQGVRRPNYRTRTRRGRIEVSYRPQDKQKQKQEEERQSSSESQIQEAVKEPYPPRIVPKTKTIVRNSVPKKRGRPKKVLEQQNVHESSASQQSQQNLNQLSEEPNQQKLQQAASRTVRDRPTNQNRKTRLQRISSNPVEAKQSLNKNNQVLIPDAIQKDQTPALLKGLILQRIKFCLNKREQLIEYLDNLKITTDIVKQILDLDVTTVILEGGQNNAESIRVLHKLKSSLLHRYFPDDIKIRKKYDKITKKSQSRATSAEAQQTLDDLQLRRKTIIKLEKILKNIDQSNDQKDKAVQIEYFFRKSDQSIGTGYKTMAYKVLRSLKDKQYSTDQIISRLESGGFDEDAK